MTTCSCCGTGAPVEPLYACCMSCAVDTMCQRCVSCGTWYHDHPRLDGRVVLGPDNLPRCAKGCGMPARQDILATLS